MLEAVKRNLRIVSNSLDDDIRLYIAACKRDLKMSGVEKQDDTDESMIIAVCLYCKWQMDFDSRGDRYGSAYAGLKAAMSLAVDYMEAENVGS